MKQVLFGLFVICLAVSCKKDINEEKIAPLTTATAKCANSIKLLTSAYLYLGTTDTNSAYLQHDTMYYNAAHKIQQVISTFNDGRTTDSVWRTFTYDAHGNITNVLVKSNWNIDLYNYNYRLFYNSNNRLDSMVMSQDYNGFSFQLAFIFTYNTSNQLQHINSYYLYSNAIVSPLAGDTNAVAHFYRNTSGRLDSVNNGIATGNNNTNFIDANSVLNLSGTPVLADNTFDKAYLFMLASQYNPYLMDTNANVYWLQFLNADQSLLKSGTYSRYSYWNPANNLYNSPFTFSAVLNADHTPRWLTLTMKTSSTTPKSLGMNRLVYSNVKF